MGTEQRYRMFDGRYNRYVSNINNGIVYRIVPVKSRLQLVVESLKKLFKLNRPLSRVIYADGQRCLAFDTFQNKKNKVLEDVPYSLVKDYPFDKKFTDALQAVYFFRYIVGFRTVDANIQVWYTGKRYYPISVGESALCRSKKSNGPGFKISPTAYDKDIIKPPKHLIVNPEAEIKKILGEITNDALYEFLDKVREKIRECDESYLWMVDHMERRLRQWTEYD